MTESVRIVCEECIEWRANGLLHREDGPAVEWTDGEKEWIIHGIYHRVDGPAIDTSVEKIWYIHGLFHREDGPAVEYINNRRYWLLFDKIITEEKFKQITYSD